MTKLDAMYIGAKTKAAGIVNRLAAKETGDETLIIKIMLMVVAVVLAIVFRDKIKEVITTLLTNVQTKITGMYD